MTVDLNIVNSKIFFDGRLLEGGISIDDGKILKVGKETNLLKSSEKINANGSLLLPGLIDAHVHLRDMELTYKEDFYTGTCAAASGGFTTVLDMPNTRPITDSPIRLKDKIRIAKSKIVVNTGFYTAFPSRIELFESTVKEGAIAFKANLLTSWSKLNLEDDEVLGSALSETSKLQRVVAVHAEDRSTVEAGEVKLREKGRCAPDDFSKAHSEEAEIKAVRRVLRILKKDNRVHFCHLSSPKSLDLINEARKKNLKVTCEVTPHHLFLSEKNLKKLGGIALTDPPLRSEESMRTLWEMSSTGASDFVVSDHAPHDLKEKMMADVWETAVGFPGLETTLPLMLTRVVAGEFELDRLVSLLSEKPASVYNLESKGKICNGYDADLTLVNVKEAYKINPLTFYSKQKYSPFQDWNVKGKVLKTFVAGKLVFDDGEIVAKAGVGKIIR
ncbi:MAG: dihydroorotase family protein [Candidatus Bathyarchaeota archaeon]